MEPLAKNVSNFLHEMQDPDNSYTPYEERPETYIVPAVFFIIFVVGVLGNGTLVVIFLRHRAMRNVPNTYILSLALADLLVIVTCVPFTSIIYTLPSWPWGVALCKISETTKAVSIGVSVFTLTALSAERYCAIVNPLRRLQTKPLTVLSAILIWILAGLLALPDAIMSHLEERPLNNDSAIMVCTPFPNPTYSKYSAVIKALVYYVIPLCIIAAFYVLMAKRLHASTREMPGEIQGQSLAQTRARRHVARMVLAIVFLFFVCFFPYHVFMLWFMFYPNAEQEYNDFWHALKIIGFCLSFINSCVNPVALYFVSGVFRQHFNRYLCCKNKRLLKRPTSHTNCETSFNSTYKRTIQGTLIERHSVNATTNNLGSSMERMGMERKRSSNSSNSGNGHAGHVNVCMGRIIDFRNDDGCLDADEVREDYVRIEIQPTATERERQENQRRVHIQHGKLGRDERATHNSKKSNAQR